MRGLKSFALFVGTFILVYMITPWMTQVIIRWLPMEPPKRIDTGVTILTTIAVYSLLRRALGERMPPI